MGDPEVHVRRLWRHRGAAVPGPRRGPQRQLDLDEILRIAIGIADRDGLAAVTTRSVAALIGKTAMALYPYVGTKEDMLALMQDHASAMPAWDDPEAGLPEALGAWAEALFEVYVAHPWLAERPWSQASQGPNEQDWLERLLRILDRWDVPPQARAVAVTTLYATVRATAGTAAAYAGLDRSGMEEWSARVAATRTVIPDFAERYPLSTSLQPVTPDWRAAPREALRESVRLLTRGLPGA
ncbi:TetR/AcrR family transcriptional regulator C-terminal domain-containing protein [Couchioplanes caeruleus]|uniref:TetR/AcrR family transcriptional regulator n=1 Tax=Couchioplanes caeruleus TaxID=56438 RepID=UPI00201BE9FD|nr:TetR/AcrR family transcriptional regulator C-terminal domain-containing protein [Couchioplanes caeruleus]UQU65857.1 TetR/AcrR family transcriptional regulator C-terminal domain-containing protein [Couchioplanes caeruleus]